MTFKRNRTTHSKTDNRREIVLVQIIFSLLFLAMILYLTQYSMTHKQDMINNSYNSRQQILQSKNYRGTIYSRNDEVLAETKWDSQGKEIRVYPYDKLFSHVVGYSTHGRAGVEAMANYYLIQSHTSLANKASNYAAEVKNPGDNVYTTLDVVLQKTADKELDLYRGAIVVSEVKTGKILAMVSHPNFDPNQIADLWDKLVKDETSSILVNRAVQGLYPPGSTFKILTALAYIREHPDDFDSYQYQCNGVFQSDGSKIQCYHGSHHGTVDFTKSFAKSCNASFANIGTQLDRKKFEDTLTDTLFFQELPLSLHAAKSTAHMEQDMTTDEMLQTAIGQGKTQMTPIHLHMITGAIANNGVMMKPQLLERVTNDAGKIIKTFSGDSIRLMSETESEALTKLMTAVVEEGTATKLKGLDYTVAGKTGSAEYNNVKGESHAWFTGFAPVEDPEICVTIIVEGAGSGGDYAVPIAKRIFAAYFHEKEKES